MTAMTEEQILAHLHKSARSTFEEFLGHCAGEVEDGMISAEPYASPIEHMMAIALRAKMATVLFGDNFWFCPRSTGVPVEQALERCARRRASDMRGWGGIFRQAIIGNYRVDFLLIHISAAPTGFSGIVVECDGHDFHERTKEQAQADKSRDRELQAAGYRVMRFTGSEIWRDAFACADEVIWMAINEAVSAPSEEEVKA